MQQKLSIRIKKLDKSSVLPSYSKEGDAGMDLTAIRVYETWDYIEYYTGLAIEIPEGYVGLIFPRSSISKTGLMLANSVGVIDSGYRGEIKFRFKRVASGSIYTVAERIGQLIIMPYPNITLEEVEQLSDSNRGEGGFGSTNYANAVINSPLHYNHNDNGKTNN